MATQITIEKKFVDDEFIVEAELLPGHVFPTDAIFVYENSGETTLGEYCGIADYDELKRFGLYTGSSIALFGNKYLRHTTLIKKVTDEADADRVVAHIKTSVTRLKVEMDALVPETEIYTVV